MVVCPSCGSTRIRSDYRPAPLIMRLILIRALLCDFCNLQFRAFSPAPPRNGRKPLPGTRIAAIKEVKHPGFNLQNPQGSLDQNGFALADPAEDDESLTASMGAIIPIQPDLRTEVARVEAARKARDAQEALIPAKEQHRTGAMCPECGSSWVRRRQRSGLERAVFAFTNHKAFICRSCDASFYSRTGSEENATNHASNIMGSRSAQT